MAWGDAALCRRTLHTPSHPTHPPTHQARELRQAGGKEGEALELMASGEVFRDRWVDDVAMNYLAHKQAAAQAEAAVVAEQKAAQAAALAQQQAAMVAAQKQQAVLAQQAAVQQAAAQQAAAMQAAQQQAAAAAAAGGAAGGPLPPGVVGLPQPAAGMLSRAPGP